MEATFRNILRLGLYGLLFMDGTPDHAAINEPVEIAKRKISSRSGDMVNAILRRAQREREANQLPKPAMPDRVKLIATTFSPSRMAGGAVCKAFWRTRSLSAVFRPITNARISTCV